MSEVCGSAHKEVWYKHSRFPLVPTLKIKKGNEYNSSGFHFNWLCLSVSDAMSPHLDFHLYLSDYSIFGFRLGLPYLNIWFALFPLPWSIGRNLQHWTWRTGAKSKFKWMR